MADRKRFRSSAKGCLAASVLVLGALGFWLIERCAEHGPDLTTDTDSSSLPTAEARVAFISRYLKTRAPVSDADFHVVFHDNSHGIPGPSDWSIAAVLRVNASDREAWLVDAARASAAEGEPAFSPRPRRPIPADWDVRSPGERYRRGSTLLVWHPEGVVEISSTTY